MKSRYYIVSLAQRVGTSSTSIVAAVCVGGMSARSVLKVTIQIDILMSNSE